ncbi:hypothetical protein [Pedobacter aquatilis]|uniref:hypothetical protein n=1 Tax=Pedobacter aquatilis TaxID=351343 RepID=UPI00292F00D5|nr:hypothetical protein [Pedobacter aquatilis]
MKKILTPLVIILAFISYTACKKSSISDGPGEVYGKWKLTETLFDPGDGSGKYTKVKEDKYLTMYKEGKMEGDALPDLSAFKIVDSVTMEVTSKTYNRVLPYRYKATANTLVLNPPCFEGCGYKFVRQ